MATWYKGTGPWWEQSPLAKGGYVSLESEARDPVSVLAYYKGLVALRRTHPEFVSGEQAIIADDSESVFMFERIGANRRTLVAVNLSGTPATARVAAGDAAPSGEGARLLDTAIGNGVVRGSDGSFTVALKPYGVGIFEVSASN
jgi:glycosidase